MELLKKTKNQSNDPRQDNADKLALFTEGRRPQAAAEIRAEWAFIADEGLCENISYQVQYLQFQINLYNDYQLYLTLESLHLKSIMGTVAGIVEAALYGLVKQGSDRAGYTFDERRSFLDLIDDAYDMELIDQALRDDFHLLRKDRNLVHFRALDYREYNSYTVEEVNEHLHALHTFITNQHHEAVE
jgi:hypothetical protein